MSHLAVESAGLRTMVQDAGRPGLAHLGISASGSWDRASHTLANRLVGNPPEAAGLEVLLGNIALRHHGAPTLVAVTGAECPLRVDGRPVALRSPVLLLDGQLLELGAPVRGLRSYLAVRGGLDGVPVFGSLSSDPTRGLGPAVVRVGDELVVGNGEQRTVAGTDLGAATPSVGACLTLRAVWGPREDWFTPAARESFTGQEWRVTDQTDRVGCRLDGQPLTRQATGELASEGTRRGAVQVPASGLPVVFGPDHPTTGGYPVIAVVDGVDADLLSQAAPGQAVRFEVRRHRLVLG
ncbi:MULTISPECIES: 5-oxoprolinase subunit C family protein [unclassified Luteococcus]|uniref:5-oxoprolinase subunit C family protein n=1 Tax=unclassified Luteococcus TaxID=2639923 RepID=UPI00313DCC56